MGTIHVVATPIGNLEDITLRALRVLREVDHIYAEDTRRTRGLLTHHGISGRPISLHSGNEAARIEAALARLATGESLAIVSDAGTPLVSDPGARLVAAAAAAGFRVESVPGASALLAALSVSGLRTHPFSFLGFLPRSRGARTRIFEARRDRNETLILFESPHRIGATLGEMAAVFGPERRACLARELTKLHEEVARGSLAELAARFADGVRGELTLVVEGGEGPESGARSGLLGESEISLEVERLVAEGLRPREIAARLAPLSSLPKRDIYARAVVVQQSAAKARGRAGTGAGER